MNFLAKNGMDFKKIYNEGLVLLIIVLSYRLIKESKAAKNNKNQKSDMDIF